MEDNESRASPDRFICLYLPLDVGLVYRLEIEKFHEMFDKGKQILEDYEFKVSKSRLCRNFPALEISWLSSVVNLR